ncbi:hypothetical protein LshimejAT787_1800500 [Lyophyllum shimeji]|uniref:Uncharacterized protein n=1 Tax=Lyophyllum shimeji TaxID=47721 RepID=A0A9P3PZ72_LYOSH|nr:hypothetical protein LshimejAT787_1800500 [Lyophyllum shimeji]
MSHRTPERPTSDRRSQVVGRGLDISEVVLATLRDAARLAPIPYLQQSATLALGIVQITQGVRNNKTAFSRLASDACELVYAILCTTPLEKGGTLSRAYLDHLQDLVKTLAEIERFATKETSRNTIIRIIKHKADLDTIKEYREKLRHSLDVFGLKSSISTHDNLCRIEEMMLEMRDVKRGDLRREGLVQGEAETWAGEPAGSTAAHQGQQVGRGFPQYGLPPLSSQNPFFPPQNPFPPLQAMHGHYLSRGGVQNTYSGSVFNTGNSGNTTTTIVSDSNNDNSVRISRGPVGRGRRW